MHYLELCELLVREFGRAEVFDKRYPDLGASDADRARLVIWVHDGVFAVGGIDRGEFVATYEFGTESEACEYVLGAMRRNTAVSEQSPQERRRTRTATDDVNGCSETNADRRVMVSRWAVGELWWTAERTWMRTHDRPIGELHDNEVLRWFGDEAFRRRDALLVTGAAVFEPELTELLGRRVRDLVAAAGWDVTADDPMAFRARRADETIEVVPRQGRHPQLEVSTSSGSELVTNLAIAESKVLEYAADGEQQS